MTVSNLQSDVKDATKNLALLESVTIHNSVYFRSKQAFCQTAKLGSLKLVPSQRILKMLEADYNAMAEMFFGNTVSFNEILLEITDLEKTLNNLQ